MRTFGLLLFFTILIVNAKAQEIDTLSNLQQGIDLILRKHVGPNTWGYWTGHNSYGDEEWAEKYYINGSGRVLGLGFVLRGNYQNASNKVRFHVKQVNTNRLPGQTLGFKDLRYDELTLNENLQFISFANPILVSDSFFVSFDLGDISHGGFEGDTIALLMGEDGSRNAADAVNFGRNAIKWHSHVLANWKDFATQNFTPIMTHFALFPIIEQIPLSIDRNTNQDFIGNVYPNPANNFIRFDYDISANQKIETLLTDFSGKEIKKESHPVSASKGTMKIDLNNYPSGVYYLQIQTQHAVYTKKFIRL